MAEMEAALYTLTSFESLKSLVQRRVMIDWYMCQNFTNYVSAKGMIAGVPG